MKISNDNPPAAAATGAAPESKRTGPSRFSRVMDEKAEELQGKKPKTKEAGAAEAGAGPGPALQAVAFPVPGPAAVPVEAPVIRETGNTQAAAAPDLIDGLVREILVVAKPGAPAIEVQFTSRTLHGLHVSVSKEGERVAIRFTTPSEAVSQLLTNNLDQLAQALNAKGIVTAPIQVNVLPQPGLPSGSSEPRQGRHEQSAQHGRQQQKRQK